MSLKPNMNPSNLQKLRGLVNQFKVRVTNRRKKAMENLERMGSVAATQLLEGSLTPRSIGPTPRFSIVSLDLMQGGLSPRSDYREVETHDSESRLGSATPRFDAEHKFSDENPFESVHGFKQLRSIGSHESGNPAREFTPRTEAEDKPVLSTDAEFFKERDSLIKARKREFFGLYYMLSDLEKIRFWAHVGRVPKEIEKNIKIQGFNYQKFQQVYLALLRLTDAVSQHKACDTELLQKTIEVLDKSQLFFQKPQTPLKRAKYQFWMIKKLQPGESLAIPVQWGVSGSKHAISLLIRKLPDGDKTEFTFVDTGGMADLFGKLQQSDSDTTVTMRSLILDKETLHARREDIRTALMVLEQLSETKSTRQSYTGRGPVVPPTLPETVSIAYVKGELIRALFLMGDEWKENKSFKAVPALTSGGYCAQEASRVPAGELVFGDEWSKGVQPYILKTALQVMKRLDTRARGEKKSDEHSVFDDKEKNDLFKLIYEHFVKQSREGYTGKLVDVDVDVMPKKPQSTVPGGYAVSSGWQKEFRQLAGENNPAELKVLLDTALSISTYKGQLLAQKSEISPEFLDDYGYSPLHHAVGGYEPNGQNMCLEILMPYFNATHQNRSGQTVLHKAIEYGDIKVVWQLLHKTMAEVTDKSPFRNLELLGIKDNYGSTPFDFVFEDIMLKKPSAMELLSRLIQMGKTHEKFWGNTVILDALKSSADKMGVQETFKQCLAAIKIQTTFRRYRAEQQLAEQAKKEFMELAGLEKNSPKSPDKREKDYPYALRAVDRSFTDTKVVKKNGKEKVLTYKKSSEQEWVLNDDSQFLKKSERKTLAYILGKKQDAEGTPLRITQPKFYKHFEGVFNQKIIRSVMVQSAWRGYKVRKEIKAATQIQRLVRGFHVRQLVKLWNKKAKQIQNAFTNHTNYNQFKRAKRAVVKLQAHVKGAQQRARYKILLKEAREEQKVKENSAALMIQTRYRSRLAKNRVQRLKIERRREQKVLEVAHRHKIKLASHKISTILKTNLENRQQQKQRAASVFQKVFRAYSSRKKAASFRHDLKKKMKHGAIGFQRLYKGMHARKVTQHLRQERIKLFAGKIHAAWNNYKVYKEHKELLIEKKAKRQQEILMREKEEREEALRKEEVVNKGFSRLNAVIQGQIQRKKYEELRSSDEWSLRKWVMNHLAAAPHPSDVIVPRRDIIITRSEAMANPGTKLVSDGVEETKDELPQVQRFKRLSVAEQADHDAWVGMVSSGVDTRVRPKTRFQATQFATKPKSPWIP